MVQYFRMKISEKKWIHLCSRFVTFRSHCLELRTPHNKANNFLSPLKSGNLNKFQCAVSSTAFKRKEMKDLCTNKMPL